MATNFRSRGCADALPRDVARHARNGSRTSTRAIAAAVVLDSAEQAKSRARHTCVSLPVHSSRATRVRGRTPCTDHNAHAPWPSAAPARIATSGVFGARFPLRPRGFATAHSTASTPLDRRDPLSTRALRCCVPRAIVANPSPALDRPRPSGGRVPSPRASACWTPVPANAPARRGLDDPLAALQAGGPSPPPGQGSTIG